MKEVGSMVVSDSPLLPPTNVIRYSDLAKKDDTIPEKMDLPVASVEESKFLTSSLTFTIF